MNLLPGVTAIVPTFNRAQYLGECLDALLAQSLRPDQILIIDDGSTDDTKSVVASYGNQVEYVYQANGGKSSALNRALTLARHADIWIFDDDDLAAPDALRSMRTALDRSPSIGFVFGRYDNFFDVDGVRTFHPPHRGPVVRVDDLLFQLLRHAFIFQAAMLVRRDCYDAVGEFDTSLPRAQDTDMLLRLVTRFDAAFVDQIVFHQRQHEGERGPANLRIPGNEVWARQAAFDERVYRKATATIPLGAFLPRHSYGPSLSTYERVLALLRRAGFLIYRQLIELALESLREAAPLFESLSRKDRRRVVEAGLGDVFRRTADTALVDPPRHLQDVIVMVASPAFSEACVRAMRRAVWRAKLLRAVGGQVRSVVRTAMLWSVSVARRREGRN